MQIFIKTIEGKFVAIEVLKNEKIIDLKRKLEEKTGLAPNDQKLVFQGSILNDDKTVDQYQINEKSNINMVFLSGNAVEIFFETADGKHISFEMQKTERIIDIKKKIQEEIGLESDEQILYYQGKILEDDKTVDECEIRDKSVINIDALSKKEIEFFAKTMDGKKMSIKVQKMEKIIDVKKLIQEKFKMASNTLKLVYKGSILEDDKTVQEYGIEDKSLINVVGGPDYRKEIKIFATTTYGRSVSFEALKTETIIDVKKRILKELGLATDEQTLYYDGRILDDDKTIDEYGIKNHSIIKISERLRHGMKIFVKTIDGKRVAFDVRKTDKIMDIKKMIQEKIGLLPDGQILIYRGYLLEDEVPLEEYGINNQSEIDICTKLRYELKVFVKTQNGNTINIQVNKYERIDSLKRKIERETQIESHEQMLIYGKKVFDNDDNDKTIDECGIEDQAMIRVIRA